LADLAPFKKFVGRERYRLAALIDLLKRTSAEIETAIIALGREPGGGAVNGRHDWLDLQ
jgi:hypothetical protein